MKMKKIMALLLSAGVAMTGLVGCGSNNAGNNNENNEGADMPQIEAPIADVDLPDELVVTFVPSRDAEEILEATEPLSEMMQEELSSRGFDFENIRIEVGTSYEASGEALEAGSAHVGFLPGGTYVLYSDETDVILTATRAGLSKDSDEAADWNDGEATEGTDEQVTYYRSIAVAGPSEEAQAVADKVNNGEEVTFEELSELSWGTSSPTSSAGYIYPSIWLQDAYGKTIADFDKAVQTSSYGDAMAGLATGQYDVVVGYADLRRDYADAWQEDFGNENTIWEDTNVIMVTEGIYNDTISVTENADFMTAELKEALQDTFISIAGTEEGLEIISIYSHEGYKKATDSDYDGARKAQELMREFE